MTALTASEQERLAALEATIERGTKAFVETGRALAEIRDSRLYRGTHETFEAYCQEHFDISRQQAYRLIDAAAVVETMSPTGDVPASERQARELAPLRDRPEEMREAWADANRAAAAEERPVTAEDVRAASVARTRPPAPPVQIRPPGAAVKDSRFEIVEDAVAMLAMLPKPGQIVFPQDPGDIAAFDEALKWLHAWTPSMMRAWRAHRTELRRLAASA